MAAGHKTPCQQMVYKCRLWCMPGDINHGAACTSDRSLHASLTWPVSGRRNGKVHTQEYSRGVPLAAMETAKAEKKRVGTQVAFLPDASIFEAK